jgi:hypothetical protein
MKKRKLALKIVALVIALFLIYLILSITNAFVGNPVSAAFAEKAIKHYVAENYSSLDLELEKPIYNFKFNEYTAIAKSKTSIDTHFMIHYRNGKVKYDDYESYVIGNFNTIQRLEKEYSTAVIPLLSHITGLDNNTSMVTVEKEEYEKAKETLTLDMPFDKAMSLNAKLIIRANLTDTTLKNIAHILEASHTASVENGYKFSSYDVFSEYKDILVMINDVTPADIENGKLEALLEEAQNYREEDSVTGKDKDSQAPKEAPAKRLTVYIKKVNH